MNTIKKSNNYNILVVTDADNTLWDTDAVYAEGQLGLLKRIESDIGITTDSEDRLAFVREVDQELVRLHNYNLKYPPIFLDLALSFSLKGLSPFEAANKAMEYDVGEISGARARKHVNWFIDHIINEKPKLRPGVLEGLKQLHKMNATIIILTEGYEKRCNSLIKSFGLKDFFSDVIVNRKEIAIYKKILKENRNKKSFMIGDQLDRDVFPAMEAGFIAIYFPGGFQPKWIPNENSNRPDYQISSFEEVPSIVLKNIVVYTTSY